MKNYIKYIMPVNVKWAWRVIFLISLIDQIKKTNLTQSKEKLSFKGELDIINRN